MLSIVASGQFLLLIWSVIHLEKPMVASLCDTFQSLAFATHRRLARARRAGYQPLEETFTDLNILELKCRHPSEIYSQAFSKRREGFNGADWEWWLTNNSRSLWLGLRVQAKVLHLATDTFRHLHYQRGKSKTCQLHKLETEAERDGLVPLYCVYTQGISRRSARGRKCLNPNYTSQSYGCALVSTTHVASLQSASKTNDLYSVMKAAVPWHCLVCCASTAHSCSDLPERAWAYLQEEFGEMSSVDIDGEETINLGPRLQPPNYVLNVLESQIVEDPPLSIQGVLVIAPQGNG